MGSTTRRLFLFGALGAVAVPTVAADVPGSTGESVIDGAARFQVLGPTSIRLEYSRDGVFEDRPTMLGFQRQAHDTEFTSTVEGGYRVLSTGRITVRYQQNSGPFTADNLRISVDGATAPVVPNWLPARYDPPLGGVDLAGYLGGDTPKATAAPRTSGNLGGWFRSLDSQSGPILLHDGLISRDGWFFIDDSHSALLTEDGYQRRPAADGDYQDGYLFGYGHDYPAALADYRALSGPATLLPRSAFGVWFSRYFPYSDRMYRDELLPAFQRAGIRLEVLMLDTDFKAPQKWNGWNWNRDLFPDPPGFLDWAHEQGLTVGCNTHVGISVNDPKFPVAWAGAGRDLPPIEAARVYALADGIGNVSGAFDSYRGFDFGNDRHRSAFMALHDSFDADGVDFWWLDWVAETVDPWTPDGSLAGDTVITTAYAQRPRLRENRWLCLARLGASPNDWGGDRPGPWGAHRSTIHFTGDTVCTWEMLDFQTYFTAAEGNTGMPYVSHDIGGFQGTLTDEMYVRWVQLGVFQPILRLHSGKNGDIRRLPWEFGEPANGIATRFLRLRGELVPYLYTLARESHDTGLPITRAMYLHWPEHEDAYVFDRQYLLGTQLLVAPVGSPGNPARKSVWFPDGVWTDWFTGETYTGPAVVELSVPLDRAPVFAAAGAIIPLADLGQPEDDSLRLHVFAGDDGDFAVYEDAGTGLGYQRAEFARTAITWRESHRELRIAAADGDFPGRPHHRAYWIEIRGTDRPDVVTVDVSGTNTHPEWTYDEERATLSVRTEPLPTDAATTVTMVCGNDIRR